MSRAERRRAKKPKEVVTQEMRQQRRERLVELRKVQRMIKSNGGRGKIKRYIQKKRERGELSSDDGSDSDAENVAQAPAPRKAHRSEASSALVQPPRPVEPAVPPPRAARVARVSARETTAQSEMAKRRERAARIAKLAAAAGQPSANVFRPAGDSW